MSCGVVHRCYSDPGLLWLWRRAVATALIGPLAWEPPYAADAALKRQKDEHREKQIWWFLCPHVHVLGWSNSFSHHLHHTQVPRLSPGTLHCLIF